MSANDTDWPTLLPDVARRLLGEPPRTEHGGDTWRYRSRGSLAVHVGGDRRGTWRDFEADVSGGALALVQHVAQTDKAGTRARWRRPLTARRHLFCSGVYLSYSLQVVRRHRIYTIVICVN